MPLLESRNYSLRCNRNNLQHKWIEECAKDISAQNEMVFSVPPNGSMNICNLHGVYVSVRALNNKGDWNRAHDVGKAVYAIRNKCMGSGGKRSPKNI